MAYNPTKTRVWKDGVTPATGTIALGSNFEAEFNRLYENDAFFKAYFLVDNQLTINQITSSGAIISILKDVAVNIINEYTVGSGVTIEGITLKDGYIAEPIGVNIAPVAGTNLHVHQLDSGASLLRFSNTTTGVLATDGFEVGIDASEQGRIWNYENTDIVIGTNNTARMYIKNDGKVNVGNFTSYLPFNVLGRAAFGSGANFDVTPYIIDGITIIGNNPSDISLFILQQGQGSAHIGFESGNNILKIVNSYSTALLSSTTGLYINQNGYLGVLTAPSNPLHVMSTTTPQVRIAYDTDSYATLSVANGSNLTIACAETGTIILSNSISSVLTVSNTTEATSSTAAALISSGGLAVAKKAYIGTELYVLSTTDSSSKDTGCAIFEGGIGVEKKLYVGTDLNVAGNYTSVLKVSDTTESTTKDTGCAILEGGLGVEKNVVNGGYLKSGLGRWPTGSLYSISISGNTIFDTLAPYIPNTNDEILMNGSIYINGSTTVVYIVAKASRFDSTNIKMFTLKFISSSGIGQYDPIFFTDGSSTDYSVCLAW